MNSPAGSHTIRRHNRSLLLAALDEVSARSRAQLAVATGLTRATVGAQVEELIASGLVIESDPPRSTVRGRPASPLSLDPTGPAAIGVEVNTGYLAVCVVDLVGQVRGTRKVDADNRTAAPTAVLGRAATIGRELLAETGLSAAGVGVALPALVDRDGIPRRAPNLPQWSGFDVAGALADHSGLPVLGVANEANLAALAEHRFASTPQDFVLVSGEVGIGGGIVLQGRLFPGSHGFAGELGHISVDPTGPACSCGSRGCVEQFAGQKALLSASNTASIRDLVDAVSVGIPEAVTALGRAGTALGIALAGVVNTLDIASVVLGGMLARLAPWLRPTLAEELERGVVSGLSVDIRASALGPDAAMLGAAGIVRDAIFSGDLTG